MATTRSASASASAWLRIGAHPDVDIMEARGRACVRRLAGLFRFAFAAVRRAPHHEFGRPRYPIERGPEHRRDAGVRRFLKDFAALAVLDFPRDLRTELEVEPVDRK